MRVNSAEAFGMWTIGFVSPSRGQNHGRLATARPWKPCWVYGAQVMRGVEPLECARCKDYGVGGWGDPNDDNQITDGAFVDFIVSYPLPHRLRRRYTPNNPNNPDELLANAFTPESQAAMVNGFQGDFIGFQVRLKSGSHAAVHETVGGCFNPPNALQLRLLTDPTQRPLWKLSVDRSGRLHRRPQVGPQWWVPDWCAYPLYTILTFL